jgi:hypothetical protein
MTSTQWIWDVVAWVSLPLLVILAGVMLWRKLAREFPFFFTYAAVTAFIGIIRFVTYKEYSAKAYFYVYWSSDFVIFLVTSLAIYEIFLKRIFPGFGRVRFYRYLFPSFAVLISIVAFLMALHAPDQRAAFLMTSRILDFLRSTVIGFFVLLILFMGRSFAGHEFSITAGFGIQAAITLANGALKLHKGSRSAIMDRLELIAFDVACVIWLWSFSTGKKAPPKDFHDIDPNAIETARKWEKSLREFVSPGKR